MAALAALATLQEMLGLGVNIDYGNQDQQKQSHLCIIVKMIQSHLQICLMSFL